MVKKLILACLGSIEEDGLGVMMKDGVTEHVGGITGLIDKASFDVETEQGFFRVTVETLPYLNIKDNDDDEY